MRLTLQPLALSSGPLASLPLLGLESAGPVLHVRLNRPAKRNSISDELLGQLHTAFANLPRDTRVAIISGEGEHFCAGLDLSEVMERTTTEGMLHSRPWHACFDQVQFCGVPVIAVLRGAVVGGGLELAASAHLRVAEASAFYALPEGTRGIFVGGGGSVRMPRLVGAARMTDMMLTGRVFDADEGQALGISNYRVGEGEGMARALALAEKIAGNAPLSNYAITQALPRIAESDEAAQERVRPFLEKRSAKVSQRAT